MEKYYFSSGMLCEHGLHASKRILEALRYAPGPILWKVNLDGEAIHGQSKNVTGGVDVSDILRKFSRMCALDVVHLWDCPDVVMRWLKTGDETLKAKASYQACCVACYAPSCVIRYAAGAASESASDLPVEHSAYFAANYSANFSSMNGVLFRDIDMSKQNRRLAQMVAKKLQNKGGEE